MARKGIMAGLLDENTDSEFTVVNLFGDKASDDQNRDSGSQVSAVSSVLRSRQHQSDRRDGAVLLG